MTVQELITELGFEVNEKGLEKFQAGLDKAANAARGVTLVIGAAALGAIGLASDYTESLNKVDVAFGDSKQNVLDWSKTTLSSFGIAQGTALDMIALYGDMATGMGLTQDAGAEMGKMLVGRAADLASFKNVSIDVANNALKGVFTGETESLKSLGVVMTEANLAQFALSQGIKTAIKDMTQAEKVNLRYAYVMEASKNAAGDFANTSQGVANQTRMVTEGLKEAAVGFGMILLPAVAAVLQEVNKYIAAFAGLDDETRKNIMTAGLFVAAIYPAIKVIQLLTAITKVAIAIKTGYMIATGAVTVTENTSTVAKVAAVAITWAQNTATTAMTAAQWLLNAAMTANPIGLVIAGIALLIGGFVLLYMRSEAFRNILAAIGKAAVDFFFNMVEWTTSAINTFKRWFDVIVLLLGPIGVLSNVLMALFSDWEKIKQAFQDGGIIGGIIAIGESIKWALLNPIIKLLGLIAKIPGMAGVAAGIQGALTGTPGGSTTGVPPTFSAGGVAGMPAAAAQGIENYNVQSSISVQVPAGTPAAQQQFIDNNVRKAVREENQKVFKKTRQSAGKVE